MIVDLIRASNDAGDLGFVTDGRRLNVLLSRQTHAVIIVRNKDCTNLELTGDEMEDAKVAQKPNNGNRHIIKLFN